jgi:hypothetical protein
VAATRAKDEFLFRLSHELRTPLTAVIGFGQLIEEEDLPPETLDNAHRIVEAGHHLLALINELLDIAKIETGNLSVSVGPVLLDEVVVQSVALTQVAAASRAIGITTDVPDGVTVDADHQRLTQVLLNLLSNAVKYNSYAGRVHLAVEPRGAVARVSIADTGPGISPDDLERLFLPFERLGAEASDVEGSGIGLALSKRLVEAMGGSIGVDTDVGQGSTFWVELALADDGPVEGRPDGPDEGEAETAVDARQDEASTRASADQSPG